MTHSQAFHLAFTKARKTVDFDKNQATQIHQTGFELTQKILENLNKFPTSAGVILMYLANKYNGSGKYYVFPKNETISNDLGLSVSTVEKQVSYLKREGLLYVRRSRSNLYYFTPKLCELVGASYESYSNIKNFSEKQTRKKQGSKPVNFTGFSNVEQTNIKNQQQSDVVEEKKELEKMQKQLTIDEAIKTEEQKIKDIESLKGSKLSNFELKNIEKLNIPAVAKNYFQKNQDDFKHTTRQIVIDDLYRQFSYDGTMQKKSQQHNKKLVEFEATRGEMTAETKKALESLKARLKKG